LPALRPEPDEANDMLRSTSVNVTMPGKRVRIGCMPFFTQDRDLYKTGRC
jgi:hypothetical protein